MIYLNHAATAYKRPASVAEAVKGALFSMGNEFRGTSAREIQTARTILECRMELAALFHFAHPERVVLTANATTAMNMVLLGSFQPGDTVIATDWDHNCVLRPLHVLESQGIRVLYWCADSDGRLHTEDLVKYLDKSMNADLNSIRALICTHSSNLTGQVLDIVSISQTVKKYGLHLIVDASQTAGAWPIDMEAAGIDVLVFTGHKSLFGPQGTGGMCVMPEMEIRPLISGGTGFLSYEPAQPDSWPAHLEAGTPNGHGIAGLKAAVEYVQKIDPIKIHQREMQLTSRFLKKVSTIPALKLYGWDRRDDVLHMPIVALNLGDISSEEVADILADKYDIAVRAGAHCAPRMHRALGTERQGAVRFSFGYFNTEEEIDQAAAALCEIAAML